MLRLMHKTNLYKEVALNQEDHRLRDGGKVSLAVDR